MGCPPRRGGRIGVGGPTAGLAGMVRMGQDAAGETGGRSKWITAPQRPVRIPPTHPPAARRNRAPGLAAQEAEILFLCAPMAALETACPSAKPSASGPGGVAASGGRSPEMQRLKSDGNAAGPWSADTVPAGYVPGTMAYFIMPPPASCSTLRTGQVFPEHDGLFHPAAPCIRPRPQ